MKIQHFSKKKILPSVLCALFAGLILLLPATGSAGQTMSGGSPYPLSSSKLSSPLILALADEPEFLSPPAEGVAQEKEKGRIITPFIGTDQALETPPPPERPAISTNEVISAERPEVTAGVNVNLGTLKFNLGYTLPSTKVDGFVRPLGVELQPGNDSKRFSLGVKIPF